LWDEGFLARLLRRSVLGKTLQVIGCVVGFFIAAYTGSLLTATNQPLWSDSTWIAPLFLTSASSTGIATMILLFRSRNAQAAGSIARLERADLCALALETVVFVVFLISLGGLLRPILNTFHGKIFLAGTLAFGLVLPLLVHFIPSKVAAGKGVAAAALVLVGGFFLRYGILTTPPELLAEVPKIVSSADVSKEKTPIGTAGPVLLSHLSPEDGRKPPEPGADSGNKLGEVQPRSKILNEP
jgi:formate-dependent nitrite reductase membrane component NrfD